MYYPFLRSKQFELLALREMASQLKNVTPIIEPVKDNFNSLLKAVEALNEHAIEPLILLNPTVGDFKGEYLTKIEGWEKLSQLRIKPCFRISEGNAEYLLSNEIDEKGIDEYCLFFDQGITPSLLAHSKNSTLNIIAHDTSPAALNQMQNVVLFGDFFKSEDRNADYKEESEFSYLHATYSGSENVKGFSDYSILSSQYKDGGGPAYVVTIHMSYIDPARFDQMFVRHYSSEDNGSPADPGGKFLEALSKLIGDIDTGKFFLETRSIVEFRQLSENGHFPGLGYVKKLSLKHHLETIDKYIG